MSLPPIIMSFSYLLQAFLVGAGLLMSMGLYAFLVPGHLGRRFSHESHKTFSPVYGFLLVAVSLIGFQYYALRLHTLDMVALPLATVMFFCGLVMLLFADPCASFSKAFLDSVLRLTSVSVFLLGLALIKTTLQ